MIMDFLTLHAMLAFAPPQGDGQQVSVLAQLVPLVLLLVVFWFVLIRPQHRKAKAHAQTLTRLRPGDRVVTSSGIVGTIIQVKERLVTIRTAADTKLELTKSSVAEIIEPGGTD